MHTYVPSDETLITVDRLDDASCSGEMLTQLLVGRHVGIVAVAADVDVEVVQTLQKIDVTCGVRAKINHTHSIRCQCCYHLVQVTTKVV